jgi:hypothetical protein
MTARPGPPAPDRPLRLAVWSGPRTISTALMRSWGNRPDTHVCDEPLYAHYLLVTSAPHPGAEEIVAHHETDWREVADWLTGPLPEGKSIFYQKHMAHHLLPDIERDWLDPLRHSFLIRHPLNMILSLDRVTPDPNLEDTGLPQQLALFERVRSRSGEIPPVLDARDVLEDPRRLLTLWTEALGVPFDERMLFWPPGVRETDGVWARHWYARVKESTGFRPYRHKEEPLPDRLRSLYETCMEYYAELYAHRLGA